MAEQKRITVGGSPGDGAGSDVPATTAPVVHDHLLAKRGRQLLANDSRHRVDPAARRVRHDQRYRSRRVILPACRAAKTDREQQTNQARTHALNGRLMNAFHVFQTRNFVLHVQLAALEFPECQIVG
jgi:hypothetical protein